MVMMVSLLRSSSLLPGGLQIESSEETDQGKYECVASNSAGVRYSSPANLYVRGRERIGSQHWQIPPSPRPSFVPSCLIRPLSPSAGEARALIGWILTARC